MGRPAGTDVFWGRAVFLPIGCASGTRMVSSSRLVLGRKCFIQSKEKLLYNISVTKNPDRDFLLLEKKMQIKISIL
jgi:hypothetical protein